MAHRRTWTNATCGSRFQARPSHDECRAVCPRATRESEGRRPLQTASSTTLRIRRKQARDDHRPRRDHAPRTPKSSRERPTQARSRTSREPSERASACAPVRGASAPRPPSSCEGECRGVSRDMRIPTWRLLGSVVARSHRFGRPCCTLRGCGAIVHPWTEPVCRRGDARCVTGRHSPPARNSKPTACGARGPPATSRPMPLRHPQGRQNLEDAPAGDAKMPLWNGPFSPSSPTNERRRFLGNCRRQRFAKGDIVFHAGDPAESLYLVANGCLAVWSFSDLGDATMLRLIGSGGFVGELSLLGEGEKRSATVRALEASETLSVRREEFERLRLEQPSVDRVLLAALASELRRISDLLMEMLFVPAETRVLRRLLSVAALWDDGVPLPITQQELAGLAGTTRATTNRALRQAASGWPRRPAAWFGRASRHRGALKACPSSVACWVAVPQKSIFSPSATRVARRVPG